MPHQPASTALEHLVVLDLTHVRAGPVCVRQLADWGANVIRIDRPGDPPDFAGRKEGDYQNKHRNKRSISLDLKSEDGRGVLHRLVKQADVLVENFRPEIKHRLKFDYESLRETNPRLVYASISAFGQDGPYKDRTGVDQIMQGMSGLMSINGRPNEGPLRVGLPITDVCTGLYAALGILVALLEREKSGEGQWVQTSLLESSLFFLDIHAARYLADGVVGKQVGNQHPTGVPTNAYPTKDGYVNIAPVPSMWGRACKAIGREDLTHHPEYSTREGRRAKRAEVNAIFEDFTKARDTAAVLQAFQAADVPCGPIYSIKEAFEDPQSQHLNLAQSVIATDGREMNLPRQPINMSRTPSKLARRTPEFAEHTDEILREFGFSTEDVERLRSRGTVE